MKQINASGLWAVVAIFVLIVSLALFVYIDQRFGPETSAFVLGAVLGIPFLLIVVAIVGLIYILIIRGMSHLQERDDAGEVERMRALRELARTDRALSQSENAQLDTEMRQLRLLEAWKRNQKQSGPSEAWQGNALPIQDWPDEDKTDDDNQPEGGASYTILD